jgi:hypothetical protein
VRPLTDAAFDRMKRHVLKYATENIGLSAQHSFRKGLMPTWRLRVLSPGLIGPVALCCLSSIYIHQHGESYPIIHEAFETDKKAANSQGIQTLLEAEKEAAKVVQKARQCTSLLHPASRSQSMQPRRLPHHEGQELYEIVS